MPPPCNYDCNGAPPTGTPYSTRYCKLCYIVDREPERARALGWMGTTTILPPRKTPGANCRHLGAPTGETVSCPTCSGRAELKLFSCAEFGKCTIGKAVEGIACCGGKRTPRGFEACPGYLPPPEASKSILERPRPLPRAVPRVVRGKPTWAYGVTTVPDRFRGLLPKTLESLKAAGFGNPHLFIDGEVSIPQEEYDWGKLVMNFRYPKVNAFANWMLGAWELFLRNPNVDRYAMFQDDLVTYPNLRAYLDSITMPPRVYWNLYTFRENEKLAESKEGWFESSQMGRGAVALVFSREAFHQVLTSPHLLEKANAVGKEGYKNIDGGVLEAMKRVGYKEMCHSPSLVQHAGDRSTVGNQPQAKALTFRGETYDAKEIIR